MRVVWLVYFAYVCIVGYQVYDFVMSPEAESLMESPEAVTALAAGVCTAVLVPYLALSALGKVLGGNRAATPGDSVTNHSGSKSPSDPERPGAVGQTFVKRAGSARPE